MNKQELLAAYENGVREFCVQFENEDLSHIRIKDTDFSASNFTNCNLSNSYFRNCNFEYRYFTDCDLSNSYFYRCNCDDASFNNCNLTNANLTDTSLISASFSYSDLQDTSLSPHLMFDSYLVNAKNISNSLAAKLLVCPETGCFRGYKQLRDNCIALLEIPASAKRSSATTRKCRASKAKVLKIWDADGNLIQSQCSRWDYKFIYEVGKTVEVKDFDENRWNECSTGIHFFMTKQEAIDY